MSAADATRVGTATEAVDSGFLSFDRAPQIGMPEALAALVHAVECGRPWAPALVQAVGRWTAPVEDLDGQQMVYLVGGEAFDWLHLAERLLRGLDDALPGSIPIEERERLLFRGELPSNVPPGYFKEALGVSKYRAHLNFFYGVVVEEALWLVVEREIDKERGVRGLHHPNGVADLVCQRLYRADQGVLMRHFHRERGSRPSVKFPLAVWKEFLYWLFKRRVGNSDSSRTASDTKKGLQMLDELRGVSQESDL
jgi:hypothetical protein